MTISLPIESIDRYNVDSPAWLFECMAATLRQLFGVVFPILNCRKHHWQVHRHRHCMSPRQSEDSVCQGICSASSVGQMIWDLKDCMCCSQLHVLVPPTHTKHVHHTVDDSDK